MKTHAIGAVLGLVLVAAGLLAGCGTIAKTGASPTTQVPSSMGPRASMSSSPVSSHSAAQAASPTLANFSKVQLTSPKTLVVDGDRFNPPQLGNGLAEPIVVTLTLSNVKEPIHLDLKKLTIFNPSSPNPNKGGIDYVKYRGKVYKLEPKLAGNFSVNNTLTVDQNSIVKFIGTVSTPTLPGSPVQVTYANTNIGFFSVTFTAPYHVN